MMFKRIITAFADALYPPRCLLCDEMISPDKYLCTPCHDKLPYVNEKRCTGCGLQSKLCECDRFIYHFDGVISPYYNEGNAKKAVYRYKFSGHKRSAEFFAENMARAVNEYYGDKSFDLITYVCSSGGRRRLDHARTLALELSKRLGTRLVDVLKPSDKQRAVQHNMKFDNRFSNVHNAYLAARSLKNKTVLLVDDIKTSGATLDECARQLKFAGANEVFCVTVTVGNKENRD